MTLEDIPAGLRLTRLAEWNQLQEDWQLFVASDQGRAFAVEKDNRVVGTGAAISYGALNWIAMMLVDPQERRSGLGGQLMEELLATMNGEDCVGLDASPMAETLYHRYGFVKECHIVRLHANIRASRLEKPLEHVRRIRPEDMPGIFSHDRTVFGADRRLLLESLLTRAPEWAWIVEAEIGRAHV